MPVEVREKTEGLLEKAAEIETKYMQDRVAVSDEAFDYLIEECDGVTTERALILLAVHGISLQANMVQQEREIVEKYKRVADFANSSVDAALAEVYEKDCRFSVTTHIRQIMYVPHVPSMLNNRPNLRFRAHRTSANHRAGWVELGVAGHRYYDPREPDTPREDMSGKSYIELAYGEGLLVPDLVFQDNTTDFTVGFQNIYDKRSGEVRPTQRQAEQVFTAIIDSAITEYPATIR